MTDQVYGGPSAKPLEGPPYVQVIDSRHCSSAWGENCCDLPNGHEGLHWDETNGNRWRAAAIIAQDERSGVA